MSEPIDAIPLPWQNEQWQRLLKLRESAQLPHALLLAGPPAVGKRQFARALAAALLCQQPTAAGLACGHCRACVLRHAGTHPDWLWVAPEETGKAIKIDQIRAVVDFIAQTSQQGGRKLVIVEPAEAMNRNAANAVLKTLEEPSGAASLLLISDAPGRLLPTIRSRCQRVDFPVPPAVEVRAWLQPRAASAVALDIALAEADGRPLLASLVLDGDGLERRKEMTADLAAVLTGKVSVIALAERWQQQSWPELLEWLIARVTRAVRGKLGGVAPVDGAVELLARAEPQALFALLDQLRARLNQTLAGGNPNVQLAIETVLFDVCDAVGKKTD